MTMKQAIRRLFILYVAVASAPCFATWLTGDDIDPNNLDPCFSWVVEAGLVADWHVDPATNKPARWLSRGYQATSGLIAAHVSTDVPRNIAHWHSEEDFGDPGAPAVADANKYWDERFKKCTRIGDATNVKNCHAYAFAEQADNGNYNYWFDDPTKAYADDMVARGANNQVVAGDLIRYGTRSHTTIVRTVANQKPTSIEWKNNSSGIYTYSPLAATAFDTPMCTGDNDQDEEIDQQPWTWSESGAGAGGSVYRDD